jgi:hypothetical protein
MRYSISVRSARQMMSVSMMLVAVLTLGCESLIGNDDEGSGDVVAGPDADQVGPDVAEQDVDAGVATDAGGLPPAEDPDPDATDPGANPQCEGAPVVTGVPPGWESSETVWPIEGMVTNGSGKGRWYVEAASGTNTGGFLGTETDGSFRVTIPLFCGAQTVKLQFDNADCSTTWVTQVVRSGCEEPELRVTLGWDELGRDWELHLIRPGGRINADGDCTWTTCIGESPDWGILGDDSDNPTKDIDDLNGYGPENIYLPIMEDGRYHIMVEHWGNGDPRAQGEVFIQLGNQTLQHKIDGLAPRHVWLVATVDWPSGAVTFSDTVVDCSGSWDDGCTLSLPE